MLLFTTPCSFLSKPRLHAWVCTRLTTPNRILTPPETRIVAEWGNLFETGADLRNGLGLSAAIPPFENNLNIMENSCAGYCVVIFRIVTE